MAKAGDRTASDKAPLAGEAVPYTAPTKGILSKVPASWVPYGELIRIHQPHGIYLSYFPHLAGLMYASAVRDVVVAPPTLGRCAVVLLIWTVFWRSTGCAWNDNIDQEFDRKTTRCRDRPIARGAVSTTNGHVFALVLSLIAFGSLRLLPREHKCSPCSGLEPSPIISSGPAAALLWVFGFAAGSSVFAKLAGRNMVVKSSSASISTQNGSQWV